MKNKFIGCYNIANFVTYLGIIFAIIGILFPIEFKYLLIFLILSGICDLFDGKFARMCQRTQQEKQFGIQVDSLADVISFLIFSSTILLKYSNYVVSYIIAIIYILCGITRLAWFNITTDGNTKYYQGLPVTFSYFYFNIIFTTSNLFDLVFYSKNLL